MSNTKSDFTVIAICNGYRFECEVSSFYPGTNFPIHSASLEPNDDPEVDYIIMNIEGHDNTITVDDMPSQEDLDAAVIEACKEED